MEQQILDGMYEQLGISREVLDYSRRYRKKSERTF